MTVYSKQTKINFNKICMSKMDIYLAEKIKRSQLLDEFVKTIYRLQELNNEIFAMTELFERDKMINFNWELFKIFKNKVNYYSRIGNKIQELRDKEQIKIDWSKK